MGAFQFLLFNTQRPMFRVGSEADLEVMIDAFIALFRLKYDNEAFKVCLAKPPPGLSQLHPPFPLILIIALYRIAIQVTTSLT